MIDSRRIATPWCCSQAVLVDRFDDKAGAAALARQLAKAGFPDAIVRELY